MPRPLRRPPQLRPKRPTAGAILRTQNRQNQIIASLNPRQQKKLKSIGFNPVLGRSGDTNLAKGAPSPQTLVTDRTLRSRRPGAVLRHEIGHQLLNTPGASADTGDEHVTMAKFGTTKLSGGKESFADPILSSRTFGGSASRAGIEKARSRVRKQGRRLRGKTGF